MSGAGSSEPSSLRCSVFALKGGLAGSIGCWSARVGGRSGTGWTNESLCRVFSFLFMRPPSLQLGMLAYSLGLKDETAFVDNLIIELESIQDWEVTV